MSNEFWEDFEGVEENGYSSESPQQDSDDIPDSPAQDYARESDEAQAWLDGTAEKSSSNNKQATDLVNGQLEFNPTQQQSLDNTAKEYLAMAENDQTLANELNHLEGQKSLHSELMDFSSREEAGTGMANASTLATTRFNSMAETEIKYVYDLINNPHLSNINNRLKKVSVGARGKTLEEFESFLGMDAKEWSKSLKFQDDTMATTFAGDQHKLYGMLQTSEAKLVSGAGTRLLGTQLSPEKAERDNNEVGELNGLLDKYAGSYFPPVNDKTDLDKRDRAVQSWKDEVIKYSSKSNTGIKAIDPTTGLTARRVVGTEASIKEKFRLARQPLPSNIGDMTTEEIYASTAVPLPNDLNVAGTVLTQGHWRNVTGGGTGYTRKEYSSLYGNGGLEGTEAGKFTLAQRNMSNPSVANTFFGHIESSEQKSELAGQMKDDFKRIGEIVKKLTPTVQDENYGNYKRSTALDITEDEHDITSALDLAAQLDISYDNIEARSLTMDEIKKHGKGADKSGMYGTDDLKNEKDRFVQLIQEGYSEDQAYTAIKNINLEGDVDIDTTGESTGYVGVAKGSDREAYKDRIKQGLEEGTIFEQRTKGWYEQREGLNTGSSAKNMLTHKGYQRQVDAMFSEEVFLKDARMRKGVLGEDNVKRSFEAQSGLSVEESYFETSDAIAGMGVSPDGHVFDKEGNSRGLAEFKYHTTAKAMTHGLSAYKAQLQAQMLVTGENEVHFYRTNEENNEVLYDIVKADPKYQERLLKGNAEIHRLVEVEKVKRNILTSEELKSRAKKADKVAKERDEQRKINSFVEDVEKTEEVKSFDSSPKQTVSAGKGTSRSEGISKVDLPQAIVEEVLSKSALSSKEGLMNKGIAPVSDTANLGNISKETFEKTKAHDLEMKQKAQLAKVRKAEIAERKAEVQEQKEDKNRREARKQTLDFIKDRGTDIAKPLHMLKDFAQDGLDSGMNTVRLAAQSGMDENRTRGMEYMLTKDGGMSSQETSNYLSKIGQMSAQFKRQDTGAEFFTNLESGLRSQSGGQFSLGSYASVKSKSPEELSAHVLDLVKAARKTNPAMAASVASVMGTEGITTAAAMLDGDDLRGATRDLGEEDLRDANRGIVGVEHIQQDLKESMVKGMGENGNAALKGVSDTMQTLSKAVDANILAILANTVALGISAGVSGGPVLDSVKGKGSSLLSGIKSAAKAIPLAAIGATGAVAAAGAAGYYGAKMLGADSLGESIGGGIYDLMNGDEAIPTPSIGAMTYAATQLDSKETSTVIDNNIEVSLTLDSDGVSITVDDDFGKSVVDNQPYNEVN